MANAGGIITLEFGKTASFVGSHYWNFQDETLGYLGDDALASAAAEVLAGKLLTHSLRPCPRRVVVDATGCCGGVRIQPDGGGQGTAAVAPLWDGAVEVLQAEPVQRSQFYRLLEDESDGEGDTRSEGGEAVAQDGDKDAVKSSDDDEEGDADPLDAAAALLDEGHGPAFFTDFCKVLLHPRSVVEVPMLQLQAGPAPGFGDLASCGSAAQEALEEIEGRVRTFAEGCDSLEGFQLLSEDSDGWAGLAASAADDLQDAYPRKPLLLFGTRAAAPSATAALTQALAAARWGGAGGLRVPLQDPTRIPRLIYDARKSYHATALMAAAIDTCTLPFRALPGAQGGDQQSCSMRDMCEALSAPAANMAAVGVRMPAVSVAALGGAAVDARLSTRERRLKGLPPAGEAHATAALLQDGLSWFAQGFDPLKGLMLEQITWRGCRHDGGGIAAGAAVGHLQSALQAEGIRAAHECYAMTMPLAVPLPFPRIFAPGLSSMGDKVTSRQAPTGDARAQVRSCAMLTRLVASSGLQGVLRAHAKALHGALYTARGKACFTRWDMQHDDVLELRESLLADAGLYDDVEFGSSSSDMDE